MIDDDADPDTLAAWYRRTPDQIAAERAAKWNAGWNALRTPDDQAYEYDPEPAAADDQAAAPTGDAVDAAAKTPPPPPPPKNAWANQELGFLDVLASGESNQGDGGYDALYAPTGHPPRHLPTGSDGTPDYSKFPIEQAWPAGPGKIKSAAGRYGITRDFWADVTAAHPDVTDWTPLNQNKAAWYGASKAYESATGRDLSDDLLDQTRWPVITSTLNGKWSSLPGGHGQQMTQDQFNQRLRDATARYRDPHPDD